MVNIKSLEFIDYKTFSHFNLSAKPRNVIVGPNNAGKSTILDSFRLTFDVLRYVRRKTATLKTQGGDGVCPTYFVPSSAIQIDLRACVHNFDDGYASINVSLDNKNTLSIKMSNGNDLECYLKTEHYAKVGAVFFREQFPLDLVIVPTLSPLEQNEEKVLEETVERNRYGRLASRNFRNYWLHKDSDEFDEFAQLVALGWPGVRMQKPEIVRDGVKQFVRMYFREGPNVREVQWAGFGFQVWMQTMTHLVKSDFNSVLVLDEPDIYLHPDLQHRLMKIISERVGQTFVATHSTEIINEADPGDIVIIRPNSRDAKRIKSDDDYHEVYKAIGSSENAQFARLARTKKVLYFEGHDAKLLSKLARKLSSGDFISASSVTLMKTEGFSNWPRVSNSSWVFKNFFGFEIPVAALFDRDYRCQAEVDEFLSGINTSDTYCEVLPFKEIENILLVPRAIKAVVRKYGDSLSETDVEEWIDSQFEILSEELKTKVLSCLIGGRTEFEARKRGNKNLGSVSSEVERDFTIAWSNPHARLAMLPGKEFFSKLAGSIQTKFKVTLTGPRVVDEIAQSEIDPKFIAMLDKIRLHLNV
jgi:hypothetical protein